MYYTTIKERYRKDFVGFWQNDLTDKKYAVLMTMGNMSLIYSDETNLLLDIFNNKLDVFRTIRELENRVIVEAKNIDYAERFDIHGLFELVGYDDEGGPPTLLRIKGIDETNRNVVRLILPSRLRVVSVE